MPRRAGFPRLGRQGQLSWSRSTLHVGSSGDVETACKLIAQSFLRYPLATVLGNEGQIGVLRELSVTTLLNQTALTDIAAVVHDAEVEGATR